MALVIGVVAGSRIKITDNGRTYVKMLTVHEVRGPLVACYLAGQEMQAVSDLERTEIVADVFVSAARGKNKDGRTRLLFEAPRHIQIKQEPEHESVS